MARIGAAAYRHGLRVRVEARVVYAYQFAYQLAFGGHIVSVAPAMVRFYHVRPAEGIAQLFGYQLAV